MIQTRNYLQNHSPATAHSKILAISLILVISSISLIALRPVSATAETSYENPVIAAPQLVPPRTASCTVILAQTQPFPVPGGNGYDTPLTGTFNPPSSFPAPWSMIVHNFYCSV